MSCNHTLVTEAINAHEKSAKRIEEVVTAESKHIYVMHDGILVRQELALFMAEVEKAFRGVKFYGGYAGLKWGWGSVEQGGAAESRSVTIAHEVLVAYPNQQYCIGTIGYGAFQKSTSNNVYAVSSRTIKNDKYAPRSEEYYYLMTSDIKRAVKNAKTHLRAYTVKDFFALSVGVAREVAEHPLEQANKQAYKTKNDIPNNQLMNELYRLHKSGHMFPDSTLNTTIAAWVEATDVQRVEYERKIPACYLHVRPQTASTSPENQLVDFFVIDNLRNTQWARSNALAGATPTTVKVSHLHPDIVGKIAVLSLLPDRDHVDGVGIRVSENVYWVFTENEKAPITVENGA